MSLTSDDTLTVDEIIDIVSAPSFSPNEVIERALEGRTDEHTAAVELVTRLDTYSQDVASALAGALGDLQRAEKRLQYQVDLLKSDISALASKQEEAGRGVMEALTPGLEVKALQELSELDVIRTRIAEVQELVDDAKEFDETAFSEKLSKLISDNDLEGAENLVSRAERIALIYENTCEEAAYTKIVTSLRKQLQTAASSSNAYGFNELLGKFQRLTS